MKYLAFILSLLRTPALADSSPGYNRMAIAAPDPSTPVQAALWFPTTEGGVETMIGEDFIFYGERAVQNAAPARGHYPLIVISNGSGGNMDSMA